jgi:hypothetical protein
VIRWFVALIPLVCAAQTVQMEGGAFRVEGWQPGPEPPTGWSSVLAIYAGEGDVPPLVGAYAIENGGLVFHPKYPLAPGMHVRAVFGSKETAFDVPKTAPPASTTRVVQVYPTTNVLPENQLKFYVCFSGPMESGEAWSHINLLDGAGKRVDLPFLEIDQELWNPEHTRLTVLFDPGRIKRGVRPLVEVGPSIQQGKKYALVIDREWRDGRGAPLAEPFRKQFGVEAPDREPVRPAKWRITAPRAASMDPLIVEFPEPLDYAMLQHAITVRGVAGKVEVTRGEMEWRFTPDSPWKAGEHHLDVQTALEDLAGNRVGRAFDVDTFAPITSTVSRDILSLPFHPRAPQVRRVPVATAHH